MSATASSSPPISHYENFPVASWLCPARLRAPIGAIYHFARTADDLADEGEASPAERLEALTAYRQALSAASGGQPVAPDLGVCAAAAGDQDPSIANPAAS